MYAFRRYGMDYELWTYVSIVYNNTRTLKNIRERKLHICTVQMHSQDEGESYNSNGEPVWNGTEIYMMSYDWAYYL